MAIVSVKETFDRSSGEDDRAKTAHRTYIVECDDVTDGAVTARTAPGIPRRLDPHPTDPTMFAEHIRAAPRGDNPLCFDVTVEYSTPVFGGFGPGSQDSDGDGVPDDPNPLLAPPRIEVGFLNVQVPASHGMYYGKRMLTNNGDWVDTYLLPFGHQNAKRRPVVNSSREPYSPLPTIESGDLVISITRNVPLSAFSVAQAVARRGKVNSDIWYGLQPVQARIADISASTAAKSVTNADGSVSIVSYWEVTYSIHVREEGWWHDILDEGTVELKTPPGGNWGEKKQYTILDADGMPKQTPTLLNGNGRVLAVTDPEQEPESAQGWYNSYLFYNAIPFTPLGLI